MNLLVQPTRSTASWLLFSSALAVAYCLTGRLCIAASAMVANVSWMLFIPAGLSLTASLLWGWRVAPAVFVGELFVGLTSHEPLVASTLMAFGNALDCALAGWWFHDRLNRRLEFDRLQDVVALLLAELLILEPVSTLFGMIGLNTAGHIPADKLWGTATAWYTANIFAKILMAPTVLVWLRWPRPAVSRRNAAELALLTALVLLVGAVGVGRWAQHTLPLPVTLIFVLPLLVWAAVRFPPSVASPSAASSACSPSTPCSRAWARSARTPGATTSSTSTSSWACASARPCSSRRRWRSTRNSRTNRRA
jgi:integral membrane sensor domain MASE1